MEGTIFPSAALVPNLSRFPLGGDPREQGRATATCYCGGISVEFPTDPSEILTSLVCHCTDCHKVSSSLYTAVFTVMTTSLLHLRGEDLLRTYTKSGTALSGHDITSFFCSVCGSLMYRRSSGEPDKTMMRLGTVDDFTLKETVLRPKMEHFTANRESYVKAIEGIPQVPGSNSPPATATARAPPVYLAPASQQAVEFPPLQDAEDVPAGMDSDT